MTITPEERAANLGADGWIFIPRDPKARARCIKEIAAAIREAVEAEREEFAKMLDDMAARGESEQISAAYSISARTVRSRSNPTPEAE